MPYNSEAGYNLYIYTFFTVCLLASAAGCASLSQTILPNRLDNHNEPITPCMGNGPYSGVGCDMLRFFFPMQLPLSSSCAGLLAGHAATKKWALYAELLTCHQFLPIAFESTGAFGQDAPDFVHDLGKRSRRLSHDPLSYLKLCQRISVKFSYPKF